MSRDSLTRRQFLKHTIEATAASAGLVAALPQALGEATSKPGSRISYFCNGEIYVTEVGKPEGKPLTTGHWDFKPSWSVTNNMLVCFRRLKDDPVTEKWKTAIFIINVDGTGFHQLTDGTHTDFNPTWTRDGHNTPIWNRRNDRNGGYHVLSGKVGEKPGKEVALTDDGFHTWAHSCLIDGRILVNAAHPNLGWGVFLLSLKNGDKPVYEPVECELSQKGQLHRASISPSEKRICFEYLPGSKFKEPGHTLYIADFDAKQRTIATTATHPLTHHPEPPGSSASRPPTASATPPPHEPVRDQFQQPLSTVCSRFLPHRLQPLVQPNPQYPRFLGVSIGLRNRRTPLARLSRNIVECRHFTRLTFRCLDAESCI